MSENEDAEIDHAEHVAAIAEFNEKAALRRVAALEARVAKLEAALERIHPHICAFGSDEELAVVEAALKDAPQ